MNSGVIAVSISALVFAGLCVYVFLPLILPADETAAGAGVDHRSELLAQRDALVQELRDLQLDFDIGKIEDDEYEKIKQRLEQELAECLQDL